MASYYVYSALSPLQPGISLKSFPQISTKDPFRTRIISGLTARPAGISMVQENHTKPIPLMRYRSFIQRNCHPSKTREYENLEPVRSGRSSIQQKFVGIIKFCRPYAITGVVLSVLSKSILPLETFSEVSLSYIIEVLKVLIATALMQIYVIGINELCDLEIDKINKPYLPLVSGEISFPVARVVTTIAAGLGIAMAVTSGSPAFFYAVLSSFVTGIVYSVDLPFLRWKKNSYLTAALFSFNFIFGTQTAIFLHFQNHVLGKPLMITKSIYVANVFVLIFICSGSLLKDIPDMEGDRANGVMTMAVKIGKAKVFKLVVSSLLMGCGMAVLLGTTLPILLNRVIVVIWHSVLATILLVRAQSVNLSDNASVQSFYMFLWKIHYAENLIFPFIC